MLITLPEFISVFLKFCLCSPVINFLLYKHGAQVFSSQCGCTHFKCALWLLSWWYSH